jgi:mannosyl-oligosaccharide alpha-1,2-mannosidase
MEFAWNGYVSKAWGTDELHPVDGSSNNWLGLGLTIVDAIDTLWIMGMKQEFNKAKDWIEKNLTFDKV